MKPPIFSVCYVTRTYRSGRTLTSSAPYFVLSHRGSKFRNSYCALYCYPDSRDYILTASAFVTSWKMDITKTMKVIKLQHKKFHEWKELENQIRELDMTELRRFFESNPQIWHKIKSLAGRVIKR